MLRRSSTPSTRRQLARQAVLEPAGARRREMAKIGEHRFASPAAAAARSRARLCWSAPRAPAPASPPASPRVVTYHFFDVVLDTFEDRAAERKAEALLDAASRDPAEKWRFVDRCFGDDVPTPPTDCASALESLRRRLAQTKLTAKQLCVCAALFPAAAVDEIYYRDEVLAGLAHLVVDFEHLESTAKAAPCHLNEEAWRRIVRRLGVLNVKDPRALGGTYNLDLQQPDERRCAGVLMALVEDLSVEQPPAPKKKGKKKEPVVVVPPKDPTPGTAFLKDLIFRPQKRRTPSRAGSCPRSGARPRVRILGSRRSGAWPAPTNRATARSRTRNREGTPWRSCGPGSRSACRGLRNCLYTTHGATGCASSDAPEHLAARARRQQRLERRRVAREEAPREAQGVHVDAVCFARAPRDDEEPAAADEQVVRLVI